MAETVLPLDDRVAIEELLSAYAVSLDLDDTDLTVSLFTDDGVVTVYGITFSGHDGIRKMCTTAPKGLHLGGRSMVTPTAAGATARHQLIFYPADGSAHRLTVYEDALVKADDGRWLFRSRDIRFMDREGHLRTKPPR